MHELVTIFLRKGKVRMRTIKYEKMFMEITSVQAIDL
jgi:hypothetical protein